MRWGDEHSYSSDREYGDRDYGWRDDRVTGWQSQDDTTIECEWYPPASRKRDDAGQTRVLGFNETRTPSSPSPARPGDTRRSCTRS